jgi:hypothetical protein
MAVYEIDYLFQVGVYFDRDFVRRQVAAGYETGSNLNHCVKARFFIQNEWHGEEPTARAGTNKGEDRESITHRPERTRATGVEIGWMDCGASSLKDFNFNRFLSIFTLVIGTIRWLKEIIGSIQRLLELRSGIRTERCEYFQRNSAGGMFL